jgi:tetratricopeptide (TPR) repeat protein
MFAQTVFTASGLNRLSALLLALALLAGCAPAPEKKTEEEVFKGIYFVENESVDLAVREDFAKAIELLQEKQYEPAIELLNEVIKGSQNNSAPYINIAIAYSMIDKPELAEKNLKQALEINPDHPVALNEYALLYRKSGRYAEAKELYEHLVLKYPEFMPARKNYGILCDLYLNDPACAVEQYEVYSEANPKDKDVKIWITTLKQKLGG